MSCIVVIPRLRLDGTTFEGESTSTKIVWQGEPAILVEIRDITDRNFVERIARKIRINIANSWKCCPMRCSCNATIRSCS